MKRKILYSPGYGAGWTTWHSGTVEFKQFMLTYQPFVDALERGEKITRALQDQFEKDALDKYGVNYVYMGGVGDLTVATVNGRVQITEYDGSEDYVEEGSESIDWL